MKKKSEQGRGGFYPERLVIYTLVALLMATGSWAAIPAVSNIQVQPIEGTTLLEISYDLQDDDGDIMAVSAVVSLDGGSSWQVPCRAVSGDIGLMVSSGVGRQFQWDAAEDIDGFLGDNCKVRIFATDVSPFPAMEYFRIVGSDTLAMSSDVPDTLGFGHPLHLMWRGETPILDGLPLHVINSMDTVFPYTDGLLGYQWQMMEDGCDPEMEDCWHPRLYDQASSDSISYFAENDELVFLNNGSGFDAFRRVLDSGEFSMRFNTIDLAGTEIIQPPEQEFSFVVNYDPETILLKGQTDWAHPEDLEIYPYYTLLNDPEQIHHPFTEGERIPDRSYVVFKALYKDDPRDQIVSSSFPMGITGNFSGLLTMNTGAPYSFESGPSSLDLEPAWDEGIGGFYADTLGFMPMPSTEFTFRMAAVDEHGRHDGTPDEMSFLVGYPPCVQCLELLPNHHGYSGYSEDLACYDPDGESHPCFGDTNVFYIAQDGQSQLPDRSYLQQSVEHIYMGIHRATGSVQYSHTQMDADIYYIFESQVYDMGLLLHGQDDPREAWEDPLSRAMAWRYQVDYDCDPGNSIADGGGLDDIYAVTFGAEFGNDDLQIREDDGLWDMDVDIVIPNDLVSFGPDVFRLLINLGMANQDEQLADEIFAKCIRQMSAGKVRAIMIDQTDCEFYPSRPGMYHIFTDVRPPAEGPGTGTWRDCSPGFGNIEQSIALRRAGMYSNDGIPVEQNFRIVFQGTSGDLSCQSDLYKRALSLPAWDAEK